MGRNMGVARMERKTPRTQHSEYDQGLQADNTILSIKPPSPPQPNNATQENQRVNFGCVYRSLNKSGL